MTKIDVSSNQRALLFKNNIFQTLLEPGIYNYHNWFGDVYMHELLSTDTAGIANNSKLAALTKKYPKKLNDCVLQITATESEVVDVYADGVMVGMVAPHEKQFYWCDLYEITTKSIDIGVNIFVPGSTIALLDSVGHYSTSCIKQETIPYEHIGLLIVGEKVTEVLSKGIYYIWNYTKGVRLVTEDKRRQETNITGQEIITKDKVTIRFNRVCEYKIVDFVAVYGSVGDYKSGLYREIQLVFRKILESLTLDELLDSKTSLDTDIASKLQEFFDPALITIVSLRLKDIILPGEMRDLFNRVVQADKEAQANLIKRLEETAATRSLLNSVRLMENNTTLLRLKELETLENIINKVQSINVTDGMTGLIDLIKINKK